MDGDQDHDVPMVDLEREARAREEKLYNSGFRDGVDEGKEKRAQEGFDAGFRDALAEGLDWGLARGAAVTLHCFKDKIQDGKHSEKIALLLKGVTDLPEKQAAASMYNHLVERFSEANNLSPALLDDSGSAGPDFLPTKVSVSSTGNHNVQAVAKDTVDKVRAMGYPMEWPSG
ncbi:hypothetical protein BSKO_01237 [Bryopsis sp. KO-2023]|nr:hypothetical protein BSKO_01237 [Bryopsis sp. KO-2023]